MLTPRCNQLNEGSSEPAQGGDKSNQDVFRTLLDSERVSLNRAGILLGEKLHAELLKFSDLHPKEQVRVVKELTELGLPVEPTLRDAAILCKQNLPVFSADYASNAKDPTLRKLERGHVVELIVEESSSGVSREQTEFIVGEAKLGAVIPLDMNHPDIRPLQLIQENYLIGHMAKPSVALELLKLINQNPRHPAFGTPEQVDRLAQHLEGATRHLRYLKGTVVESPDKTNEYRIVLDDGQTIEACNVRLANIISIDEDMLLARGDRELYVNQRVWVYCKRSWHKATVIARDDGSGAFQLLCDEQLYPDYGLYNGRGLSGFPASVGINVIPSNDIELTAAPSIIHPLDRFPHVEYDQCIRFENAGESGRFKYIWGYIYEIDPCNESYSIRDSKEGYTILKFSDPVTVLDRNVADTLNPLVKPGNIIDSGQFADSARNKKVYKILAIDPEQDRILVQRTDFRSNATCEVLALSAFHRADCHRIYDRSSEFKDLQSRFTWLQRFNPESYEILTNITFHSSGGKILKGQPLDLSSFPYYIDILIPKPPEVIRAEYDSARQQGNKFPHIDHFDRHKIRTYQIISWDEPQ